MPKVIFILWSTVEERTIFRRQSAFFECISANGLKLMFLGGCLKMNSRYAKGRRFEWRVKDFLLRVGFQIVIRSAGSKQIDLVAIRNGVPVLIECKSEENVNKKVYEEVRKMGEECKTEAWVAKKKGKKIQFVVCYAPRHPCMAVKVLPSKSFQLIS